MQASSQFPTDCPARISVQHHCEKYELLSQSNIGDVRRPKLVDLAQLGRLGQVRVHPKTMIRVAGDHEFAAGDEVFWPSAFADGGSGMVSPWNSQVSSAAALHDVVDEPQTTFSARSAAPAPFKFASFISEYLRDKMMPSAPPLNAAMTASRVPSGDDLLFDAA